MGFHREMYDEVRSDVKRIVEKIESPYLSQLFSCSQREIL